MSPYDIQLSSNEQESIISMNKNYNVTHVQGGGHDSDSHMYNSKFVHITFAQGIHTAAVFSKSLE